MICSWDFCLILFCKNSIAAAGRQPGYIPVAEIMHTVLRSVGSIESTRMGEILPGSSLLQLYIDSEFTYYLKPFME